MNEVLRDEYIEDCQRGVDQWNKTIKDEGIAFELKLPSNKFHRQIGMWADAPLRARRQAARRRRRGTRAAASGCRPTPTRPTSRA